jgi:uncharacterized protein YjaZ/uncharacterized membrane protein
VVAMQIIIEDTIKQYEKLFSMEEEKEDFYRYSMMKPFEKMWNIINVPLKANQPNGYDVIMATKMLGYLDISNTETGKIALEKLKEIQALQTAYDTLKTCVNFIQKNNLKINADELKFGMYIADPEKLELQKGYCGFGGIPGFIQVSIYPNSYNIPKIPAVIAHEFHHNIRFSYFDWDHGNVTVGDYLIIEGLAESFARELYGDEFLGPWVTSFDKEELERNVGEESRKYKLGALALVFPILYAIVDALGTFLDDVYLSKLMSPEEALISYELTFLFCGILSLFYLVVIKKEKFMILREKDKALAAIFETAGQFFYVYALDTNSVVVAPMIASYSIVSVILGRIFLKEKLSLKQYLIIAIVMVGIFLLGLFE